MTNDLVELINKAKEAVSKANGLDEEQKKIAFQTILSELMRSGVHANQIQEVEPLQKTPVTVATHSESIEELYNQMKPQKHTDIVMFLSYHLYKQGKMFTTNDIVEAYKKILVPSPTNPTDIINKNRKKGFIMFVDSDDKGRAKMQITRTGIIYVESGFKRDQNGDA